MSKGSVEEALQQFVHGELSTEELEARLASQARFRFWDTNQRDVHLVGTLPRVLFSRADIDAQLQRFLAGGLPGRALSDWAGAIRLLGCFKIDEDEPGSSEAWDLLDELMSPDAWGPVTVESVLDLRKRLNAS